MALKFRPITYNEGDFRAYKYIRSTALAEGQLCFVASVDQHTMYVAPYDGVSPATFSSSGGASLYQTDKYFPIYREDPDIENVSATISQNDFVIGFTGYEWEVDVASCEDTIVAADFTTIGQSIALGSNGKFTPAGDTNATGLIVAICLGTFNSKWIRMQAI